MPLLLIRKLWIARQIKQLLLGYSASDLTKTETVARLSLNSTLYQTQPKFQSELNWGSNSLECNCSTWSGNEQVGQWKPPSENLWLVRGAVKFSDFVQRTSVTAPWCRPLTEISEYGHWGGPPDLPGSACHNITKLLPSSELAAITW